VNDHRQKIKNTKDHIVLTTALLGIMPKIKIFPWKLCHNALPSHGALFYKGLQLEPNN